jgi:hypothetical protein
VTLFERGTPGNTVAASPTRDFRFVVEPLLVDRLAIFPFRGVAALLNDLAAVPHGVRVALIAPGYLTDRPVFHPPSLLEDRTEVIARASDIPSFKIGEALPATLRRVLRQPRAEITTALALLALAEAVQAEGIVTESPVLIDARYPLYQHHRLRIIPLGEFGDVLESCAHGHGLFWSSTHAGRHYGADSYYQMLHPTGHKLAMWFGRVAGSLAPAEHHENVRSATLNRYPFILYSRDMVRFYELQLDHFARRGLYRRFGTTLGYYITNFYVHVWGMLEQLTVIAKDQRGLDIPDTDCGIHKTKTYWQKAGAELPTLRALVKSREIAPWIAAMADVRHAAAHRAMALPSSMVTHTGESQLSDDEVRARLREDDPDFYEMLAHDPETLRAFESVQIPLWRANQMKTVADNVVIIRGRSGTSVRGAVVSIDYDVSMLGRIIEAFCATLFPDVDPPGIATQHNESSSRRSSMRRPL